MFLCIKTKKVLMSKTKLKNKKMKPTKEQIYQIGKEKFVSDLKPY